MRSIVWFRGKDLRLDDHEPLRRAIEVGGDVLPVIVLEDAYFGEGVHAPPNRLAFFLESVAALADALHTRGSRLLMFRGRGTEVIPRLAGLWGVNHVFAQDTVEPGGRRRDDRVAGVIGQKFERTPGETIHPPGTLRTMSGKPYAVYSPFARAWRRDVSHAHRWTAPSQLPSVSPSFVGGVSDEEFRGIGTAVTSPARLVGGSSSAIARLDHFIDGVAVRYKDDRNQLGVAGTSRLSADLRFGTVSPRHVWQVVTEHVGDTPGGFTFESELIWREFAYSTMADVPSIVDQPFQADFAGFPWRDDPSGWDAWVHGMTGYPVVDAASRQLIGEGYVHNRARMISASFLTKDLMIDYRRGENHYRHWLTDGDIAQNVAGWQWTAGCGCDPQPYFRIFNPVTQGQKFDPEGSYVREWVPELRSLPNEFLHAPWLAPQDILRRAGVTLGTTYPRPIIEHGMARDRFLGLASDHLKRTPGSTNAPLPIEGVR